METKRRFSKELFGSLTILASAFCFYLATVVVHWAMSEEIALSSQFLVFVRFLMGFLVVGSVLLIKRKIPRPHQYHFLLGRAFFNILAVTFFFKAIEETTVAEGNILNMTYPIFIAIISWIVFREQRDFIALGMTFVAFCGIFLVLAPGELRIEWNSLWGLASGTTAAIAIIFLSLARRQNDTDTVLFIMFGSGTVLLYIFFWKDIHIPNQVQLFYLVLCASMGVMGQYLLTLGFRYVTAVKGGIISLFRILLAAFLGPYITSDPALEMSGWIGALLILGANIYFIVRKSR
jgi:drug/metabolite transporter (DMT)-like permease